MLSNNTGDVIRSVMPNYLDGVSDPFTGLRLTGSDCIAASLLADSLEGRSRIVKHDVLDNDTNGNPTHYLYIAKNRSTIMHTTKRNGFVVGELGSYAFMFDGGFSSRMISGFVESSFEPHRKERIDIRVGGKDFLISVEDIDPDELLEEVSHGKTMKELRSECLKKYLENKGCGII